MSSSLSYPNFCRKQKKRTRTKKEKEDKVSTLLNTHTYSGIAALPGAKEQEPRKVKREQGKESINNKRRLSLSLSFSPCPLPSKCSTTHQTHIEESSRESRRCQTELAQIPSSAKLKTQAIHVQEHKTLVE